MRSAVRWVLKERDKFLHVAGSGGHRILIRTSSLFSAKLFDREESATCEARDWLETYSLSQIEIKMVVVDLDDFE